jgi:putative addiction module component (TIGR02574 family)
MARTVSELEREIRGLAPADQERLFRVLLEELDGPADPDVEEAWLEEVKRRSRELDDGTVKTIPGDEVFTRLREALKR